MSYFDLDYIDPEMIKEYNKHHRSRERDLKRADMLSGLREPVDRNFNILSHGQFVYIKTVTTPIKGRVRFSKEKDAYVIEMDDGKLLSHSMINPNAPSTSIKPIIFDLMKPNHRMVFLNQKDLEMSYIDFITSYAHRNKTSVGELLGKVQEMIEKYPEEFI